MYAFIFSFFHVSCRFFLSHQMSTSTRGDYSMASTSTAQTSKPKSTAKLHAHDVLGPADVAFVQVLIIIYF